MRSRLISMVFLCFMTASSRAYLPPAGPVFDRTAFGFTLSIDRCYRDIRYDGADSSLNAVFNDRQKHEDPMMGYSVGLSLRKQRSLHWILEAGLRYTIRGYQYRSADKTFGPAIDTNYVTVTNVTQALDEILIRHQYRYVEVPLRLHYQFTENRLRYHVAAGIALGLPLGVTVSTRYKFSNGEREVKRNQFPDQELKISITPILSAGMEFYYSHRLRFYLDPTYQFALNDAAATTIRERLNSAGLQFGVIYRYR